MSEVDAQSAATPRNRSKLIASLLLLSVALAAIAIEVKSGHSTPPVTTEGYFTTDDGKNFFADDKYKISGFDHEGRPAYRAYVFQCSSGSTFVGFIERYTPAAVKRLQEAEAHGGHPAAAAMAATLLNNSEVKRPGDVSWVKRTDPAAAPIVHQIKCPDGSTGSLEPVDPR